ncbi:MAG TPA: pitrilysin family protein [Magnetospirillaceae bacterium]|jgi:zinc protease
MTARSLGFALILVACVAVKPAFAQVFGAEAFTLPNGMQIVAVPNHRAPVVSSMMIYKVGGVDEMPGKTGLAHMVEHMMFKGTKTVLPGMFSRIVAANGGRDDAFTSEDYTGYYQDISADRLPEIMRLEADRMVNLSLHEKDFTPEHQVVLEEERMRVENSPEGKFDQQMNAALYLNAAYHHPVIGWKSEVEGLTLADVIAFHDKWYAPNNAVLIVSGDITLAQLKPMAEKYFGSLPARKLPPRLVLEEPHPLAARSLVMKDGNVHQPSWNRMYLAPSHHAGDTQFVYPLEVLAQIVGSDTTSRLYRHLVIEQKLASEVWAGYSADARGPTSFDFFASPNPGVDIDKIATAMDAEIMAIVEQGVTPEDVQRAKTKMRAEVAYARDSYQTGARVLAGALATGGTIADVEEWPQRIAAVTPDQVNEAARAILREERSVTGELLPAKPGEGPPVEPGSEVPPETLGKSLR